MITDKKNIYVRLNDIIRPTQMNGGTPLLSISRSGWLTGVQEGRFPKPIKLSPRVSVWRLSDIEESFRILEAQS